MCILSKVLNTFHTHRFSFGEKISRDLVGENGRKKHQKISIGYVYGLTFF